MKTAIVGLVCLLGAAGWARGDRLQVRCTEGPTQVVTGDTCRLTYMVLYPLPEGAKTWVIEEEARRREGHPFVPDLSWNAYSVEGEPVVLSPTLGPGWSIVDAEGPRLAWLGATVGHHSADMREWPVRIVGLRTTYEPDKVAPGQIRIPLGVVKPGDVVIVTLNVRYRRPGAP